MKPKTVDGDMITILCVGRDRRKLTLILEESGIPYCCDWVEGGEATLKQDYHDLAIVSLGDRSETHQDPMPEPTRDGLSLVGSTGIPTVILGSRACRDLLEEMQGTWDWDFVDQDEASDDPYQLLRGMRSALNGYLKAVERPETCHRQRALTRITEHFVGDMPWN
tara:strand:- start:13122 stop:13616 length:495 start_codon:yes stop_codon:yes gene_type:complete